MTSLPSAARHVRESLRDPLDPKFCVRYYLYFVHLIHFDGSSYDYPPPIASDKPESLCNLPDVTLSHIRERHPGVLQGLMNLLRTERSRDEMRALAERMETCACDRSDPVVDELHAWHWLDHETIPGKYPPSLMPRTDTMLSLVSAASSLLAIPIEESCMALHSGQQRADEWPETLSVALGNDWSQATVMICRWLDEYTTFQVAHLLGSFAEGELIVSTLLHSATLPKNLVYLLDRGLDIFPDDVSDLSFGASLYYLLPLTTVLNLISCVESIVDGVSTAYFYEDQAEPVLDVLTRIGRLSDALSGDSFLIATALGRTGGAVHSKLVLPYDETRYHPTIIEASKSIKEENILDVQPYATSQKVLYILMTMRKCGNPRCTKEQDPSWMRCTACKRVLYCSSECQRADWEYESKPHKKICKTLRALGEAVSFPVSATPENPPPIMSTAEFRRECMQAGVEAKATKLFAQRMMRDDRVLKSLNDEYSKRYDCRLS